ncbi:MAG: TetR/AcrR family transcriptional regulator [Nocardioidaceae bacterium]
MTAPRTAREIARAELTRAIVNRAREQLAEVGPAALSVRAVSRDLGMASSAVYRYFPSRDALLTALLIACYDELGAAVEKADLDVTDRADLALRWKRICHAIRDWAVAAPHEYALLYGSPVPGYAAPQDTVAAAARVPQVMLALAHDAQQAGLEPDVAAMPVPRREHRALAGIRDLTEFTLDDDRLVRSLMAWSNLFGHISLELFGHMHRGVLDYDAHFAHVVDRLAGDLGLA